MKKEILERTLLPEHWIHRKMHTKSDIEWRRNFCRKSTLKICTFCSSSIYRALVKVFREIWIELLNNRWPALPAYPLALKFPPRYGQPWSLTHRWHLKLFALADSEECERDKGTNHLQLQASPHSCSSWSTLQPMLSAGVSLYSKWLPYIVLLFLKIWSPYLDLNSVLGNVH